MTRSEPAHHALHPLAGLTLSPSPWACQGDLAIVDAAGRAICVLGDPFGDATEQDITNGAAIVQAPRLIAALRGVLAIRPGNWDDDEDPDHVAAWTEVEDALLAAGIDLAEDEA